MRQRLKEYAPGVAFVAPTLVLFLVFVAYPIVYNVQGSLLDWDGVNPGRSVGLGNYRQLLSDPIFMTAIKNSVLWFPLTFLPQAGVGIWLAVVLNRKLPGRTFFRSMFFIPVVLSPIVVGIVWQRVLDPFNGVIASVGRASGIEWLTADYLGNPDTAIFAVMVVNNWMWTGFAMLFYLGGLQLIDPSVQEAARIDGASSVQAFWRITFPLLRSTHLSLVLLGVIGALKTFDLVYVLTDGGPNHASEMLPTYAFQKAFVLQDVGYASTISVVLVVISVVASLSMVRVFGAGFITGEEK